MWFVVPTPPHVVNGIEKGSLNNCKFSIRSDEEARAYLNFRADGVELRSNYIEVMEALREQLLLGRMPFGRMDEPKLKSSVRLFERIADEGSDEELHAVTSEILDLLQLRAER